jgi:hypothetical protein
MNISENNRSLDVKQPSINLYLIHSLAFCTMLCCIPTNQYLKDRVSGAMVGMFISSAESRGIILQSS